MEKKTIGAFIAALRRASGLTQRELAEKLNVSDKAVSRWEREESLPDLSLIPAIAEIFGVTADELLRGERMKPGESQPRAEEKSEKQLQNLVRRTVVSLSTRSLIAAGIALAGFIAALIADLGFLRGYVAFYSALAFYVVAALCQAGFLISALSALSLEDGGAAVENGRRSVLNRALWVFGLIITLFAATLPVVILPYSPYFGLSGDSWLEYGSLFGAFGLLLSMLIARISGTIAIKRGLYSLDAKQTARRRLRMVCVLATLGAVALTFVGEVLLTSDTRMYADKIVFDNYDDFTAYMMRKDKVEYQYGNAAPEAVPGSETVYYDENGNPVTEKQSRMQEIVNSNGETVLRYYRRNDAAVNVSYPLTETCLPISVITQNSMNAARRTVRMIEAVFIAVYILEFLAGAAVYIIKSRRIKNQPA